MSKKILVFVVVILVGIGIVGFLVTQEDKKKAAPIQTDSQSIPQTTSERPQGFDKNMFALDEPGSPWWVVNKKRPLPSGYVPPDLAVPNVKLRLAATAEQMQFSKSATPALEEMFAAAKSDGIELVFGSGYRSEALQRQFYNSYVAQDGQAAADRYSARPGTSEHQTGLVFDATAANGACHLEICFEETPEGKWIIANAYKYGFIIRYANGKEDITGYQYEPWHLRYVGKELAAEMNKTGVQTLEEFFGLPAAPSY
jgi:zinc D-Ala-D-Ala carboxypeptidase